MNVEGITVWEGEAGVMRDGKEDGTGISGLGGAGNKAENRKVFKSGEGWTVVWRGSLPIGQSADYGQA